MVGKKLQAIVTNSETRESIPFDEMEITVKGIRTGLYKHYKGKNYEVIGLAKKGSEELVVYKALYDDPVYGRDSLWMRPKEMFEEYVTVEGKKVPRFAFVKK